MQQKKCTRFSSAKLTSSHNESNTETKQVMISPPVFRALMAFLTPDPDEEEKSDTRETSSIGLHGEDLVHAD